MQNEIPRTTSMGRWPALFITLWLNRDIDRTRTDPDTDRAYARKHTTPRIRRRVLRPRITRADRAWLAAQTTDTDSPAPTDDTATTASEVLPMTAVQGGSRIHIGHNGPAGGGERGTEEPWFELDLFASFRRKTGSRFDDTVALPTDAPQRLEAIVQAADLRLRALPPAAQLGHRTLAYRTRLQQISRDAMQARARLADGSYGLCLTCTEHIGLAVLTDRPWARLCTYCALDI